MYLKIKSETSVNNLMSAVFSRCISFSVQSGHDMTTEQISINQF